MAVSDERLAEYKEAFAMFDLDGNMAINTKELGTVMRALGQIPTQKDIDAMIAEIDTDGSGMIEFNEFVNLMERKRGTLPDKDQEEALREAFKIFDRDGNGLINAHELKHVMTTLGERLTDEEVDDMLVEADLNEDGTISYEEFVKLMSIR